MAEFTFSLRYDAIPPEVLAAARRHLADTLACALGAYDAPPVEALRKHALAQGGRADATILGTETKVPAALAALVNGTMVRYLDANDIFVLRRGGLRGTSATARQGCSLSPSAMGAAAKNCSPSWWHPTSYKAHWLNR